MYKSAQVSLVLFLLLIIGTIAIPGSRVAAIQNLPGSLDERLTSATSEAGASEFSATSSPSIAKPVIHWSSTEAISRFEHSQTKTDFFTLAPHFEGQSNKVFCGIASMTVVANALLVSPDNEDILPDTSRISAQEQIYFPAGDWSPFFHRYTQESIAKHSSKPLLQIFGKPVDGQTKADYGLQLNHLDTLAKKLGFLTDIQPVPANILQQHEVYNAIKRQLILALIEPEKLVIINYSRVPLQQRGHGHFSPLAAYHAASDSFLVMDVSNTYQTWVWITSEALFSAMAVIDGDNPRGYLVINNET